MPFDSLTLPITKSDVGSWTLTEITAFKGQTQIRIKGTYNLPEATLRNDGIKVGKGIGGRCRLGGFGNTLITSNESPLPYGTGNFDLTFTVPELPERINPLLVQLASIDNSDNYNGITSINSAFTFPDPPVIVDPTANITKTIAYAGYQEVKFEGTYNLSQAYMDDNDYSKAQWYLTAKINENLDGTGGSVADYFASKHLVNASVTNGDADLDLTINIAVDRLQENKRSDFQLHLRFTKSDNSIVNFKVADIDDHKHSIAKPMVRFTKTDAYPNTRKIHVIGTHDITQAWINNEYKDNVLFKKPLSKLTFWVSGFTDIDGTNTLWESDNETDTTVGLNKAFDYIANHSEAVFQNKTSVGGRYTFFDADNKKFSSSVEIDKINFDLLTLNKPTLSNSKAFLNSKIIQGTIAWEGNTNLLNSNSRPDVRYQYEIRYSSADGRETETITDRQTAVLESHDFILRPSKLIMAGGVRITPSLVRLDSSDDSVSVESIIAGDSSRITPEALPDPTLTSNSQSLVYPDRTLTVNLAYAHVNHDILEAGEKFVILITGTMPTQLSSDGSLEDTTITQSMDLTNPSGNLDLVYTLPNTRNWYKGTGKIKGQIIKQGISQETLVETAEIDITVNNPQIPTLTTTIPDVIDKNHATAINPTFVSAGNTISIIDKSDNSAIANNLDLRTLDVGDYTFIGRAKNSSTGLTGFLEKMFTVDSIVVADEIILIDNDDGTGKPLEDIRKYRIFNFKNHQDDVTSRPIRTYNKNEVVKNVFNAVLYLNATKSSDSSDISNDIEFTNTATNQKLTDLNTQLLPVGTYTFRASHPNFTLPNRTITVKVIDLSPLVQGIDSYYLTTNVEDIIIPFGATEWRPQLNPFNGQWGVRNSLDWDSNSQSIPAVRYQLELSGVDGSGVNGADPLPSGSFLPLHSEFRVRGRSSGFASFKIPFTTRSLAIGTYDLTISVFDAEGITDDAGDYIQQFKVRAELAKDTTPPVITIHYPSSNQQIQTDHVGRALRATATDVRDGTITTIAWRDITDMDNIATITNPATIIQDLIDGDSIGTYTYEASATDKAGNVGKATVTFTILNPPDLTKPVITILEPTVNQRIPQNTAFQLRATAIDNVDGNLTSRLVWKDITDSNNPITLDATKDQTLSQIGAYTYEVSVSDSSGNEAKKTVMFTVVREQDKTPPTLTITNPAEGQSIPHNQKLTLMATAIDDRDGNISNKVKWFNVTDPDDRIELTTITDLLLDVGSYVFEAVVEDLANNIVQEQVAFRIIDTLPPVITITKPANKSQISQGSQLTLEATALDNIDGNISTQIIWTANGRVIESGVILDAGVYEIVATATDSVGLIGSASVSISVIHDFENTTRRLRFIRHLAQLEADRPNSEILDLLEQNDRVASNLVSGRIKPSDPRYQVILLMSDMQTAATLRAVNINEQFKLAAIRTNRTLMIQFAEAINGNLDLLDKTSISQSRHRGGGTF